ncbi:MAG: hypothetical protein R3A80_08705 [Bdellovibrionota bacterium]
MSKSIKSKSTWGGARPGAGRPKTSPLVSHLSRPRVGRQRPLLITLKIRSAFGDIRNPEFLSVFEKACQRARRFGLRIIHYSFLPTKILLFVEVKKQEELEKSFKSLNTALAVYLKKDFLKRTGLDHRGAVFLGRFEMKTISSAEESKAAIREVLFSPAKLFSRKIYADTYSSGALFGAWDKLLESDEVFEDFDFKEEEISQMKRITATPQFWLSQSAWREKTTSYKKELSETL